MLQISAYIDADIVNQLKARSDNRSAQIVKDLGRLYHLFRYELKGDLYKMFTVDEYCVIFDALEHTNFDDYHNVHVLYALVEANIAAKKLHLKWELTDIKALIDKLRMLSFVQSMAIADAVERFWHKYSGDDYPLVQDNVRKLVERYTYKDLPSTAYNS